MARFKAFPDIEIPEWALALGFKDVSFARDMSARMAIVINEGKAGEVRFNIWVDAVSSTQRKIEDFPRFMLDIWVPFADGPNVETLWETEDEGEALDRCKALMIGLKR